MPDSGGHAPNLAVFALDEFKTEPDGRDGLAGTNRREARCDVRLWFEQPRLAWEGLSALDDKAFLQFAESFRRGNIFDLRPIKPRVAMARVEKLLIQRGFIAEEKQAFGIRIEPSDGIDILGKTEVSQRAIRGAVGCELGNHAIRLMEGDEHC